MFNSCDLGQRMGRKISLCQQKELCVLLAVMPSYSVPCSVVGTNKMTNKALVHDLGMMAAGCCYDSRNVKFHDA